MPRESRLDRVARQGGAQGLAAVTRRDSQRMSWAWRDSSACTLIRSDDLLPSVVSRAYSVRLGISASKGAHMRLLGSHRKSLAVGIALLSAVSALLVLGSTLRNAPQPRQPRRVPHFQSFDRDLFKTSIAKVGGGGEPESRDGAAQESYDNRAYPALVIDAARQLAASAAAANINRRPGGKSANWQELGPSGVRASGLVASESTGGSVGVIFSGRTTAIAISPACHANDCKIFIGAAGGGVWQADNALAAQPNWHPSGNGIASN